MRGGGWCWAAGYMFVLAVCLPIGGLAIAQEGQVGGDAGLKREFASPAPTDLVGGPIGGLDFESQSAFRLGRSLFRKEFTRASEGEAAFDGLGPLFNARSCAQCHINDGRGALPPTTANTDAAAPNPILSMILKFTPPHPIFGQQLQTHGVVGVPGEGQVKVSYQSHAVTFPDGEIVHLQKPVFAVSGPNKKQIQPEQISGARLASPMFGLGALAAISQADLRRNHDPDDADGDSISGRLRDVFSPQLGTQSIGRFGWKADMATLEDQVATALALDMGLSSALVPRPEGDCTAQQTKCLQSPNGEGAPFPGPEISKASLDWLTFYSASLEVPAPRPGAGDPVGQNLFADTGCAVCHTPSFELPGGNIAAPYRGLTIYPYTDLALHDLGEGLADRASGGGVNPKEWRTPPLWGVGLSAAINGNSGLLHDGRARSLSEAILWHGGEAARSRDRFMALPRGERQRLLDFVAAL